MRHISSAVCFTGDAAKPYVYAHATNSTNKISGAGKWGCPSILARLWW